MFFSKKTSGGAVEYIIVGLGNLGKQYDNTRHNAGFNAMDRICEKYQVQMKKIRFKSTTGECVIEGKKCLLMKPSTYMNNSGQAVVEAMNFYKIDPANIIIIFDDISLDVGKMRIRQKGSDGGHNGMKNIIYLSGSDMFPRVKIGVGKKPHPDYDLKDWVLSRFSSSDDKLLRDIYDNSVSAVEYIVSGDIQKAMASFN